MGYASFGSYPRYYTIKQCPEETSSGHFVDFFNSVVDPAGNVYVVHRQVGGKGVDVGVDVIHHLLGVQIDIGLGLVFLGVGVGPVAGGVMGQGVGGHVLVKVQIGDVRVFGRIGGIKEIDEEDTEGDTVVDFSCGSGFEWREANGDNRYYVEHICGNFYYYEASF